MLTPQFTLNYIQKGYIETPPPGVVDFVKKSTYKATAERVIADGKVWGVPLFHGHILLFWNKKHFADAGLPGPPKTWDDLAGYGKKLTKYDATGAVTRSGIALRLTDDSGAAQKFEVFLRQAGGLIVEPTADGKWRAGYNNDAGRDALKLFLDLVWKQKVTSHAIKGDFMGFAEGVASMVQRESFVINYLAKSAPGVEYGIAEVPRYKHEGTIGWSHALWVPKTARTKQAAWDFILTVMKPEYAVQQQLQGDGWTYSRSDLDLGAVYAKLPQHRVFADTMAKPGYVHMEHRLVPADEIWTKFAQKMATAWKTPTLGDNPAGIAKALADAAAETDAILKREGLYGGK
jgi:multiple sugar transport system substrate-binding protein